MSFFQKKTPRSAWLLLAAAISLVLAFPPSPAAAGGAKLSRGIMVMGTVAEVTIYDEDEAKADAAIEKVFKVFDDVDNAMSLYKEDSELSRLNAAAREKPARVSGALMRLIEKSIWFSQITGGAFDITVAPLMETWGFVKERKELPPDETVRAALERVGYEKILLDEKSQTVGFGVPGMRMDLGGIAKGYAVDLAVEELRGAGIENALVNLGGNIYAMGNPPGETAWEVGVRDPRDGEGVVDVLRLRNRAAATSGSHEKFVMMEGKRYSHIMDPRTGMPSSGALSVTVTADTALEADALSTAFFVLGRENSEAVINKLDNVEALFILPHTGGRLEMKRIDPGARTSFGADKRG